MAAWVVGWGQAEFMWYMGTNFLQQSPFKSWLARTEKQQFWNWDLRDPRKDFLLLSSPPWGSWLSLLSQCWQQQCQRSSPSCPADHPQPSGCRLYIGLQPNVGLPVLASAMQAIFQTFKVHQEERRHWLPIKKLFAHSWRHLCHLLFHFLYFHSRSGGQSVAFQMLQISGFCALWPMAMLARADGN